MEGYEYKGRLSQVSFPVRERLLCEVCKTYYDDDTDNYPKPTRCPACGLAMARVQIDIEVIPNGN